MGMHSNGAFIMRADMNCQSDIYLKPIWMDSTYPFKSESPFSSFFFFLLDMLGAFQCSISMYMIKEIYQGGH